MNQSDIEETKKKFFDLWWNEIESFSARSERFFDEGNTVKGKKWVKAAFEAGVESMLDMMDGKINVPITNIADVYHEGTDSYYRAFLLEKLDKKDVF